MTSTGFRHWNFPFTKWGDACIRANREPEGSRPNFGWLVNQTPPPAARPTAPKSPKRNVLRSIIRS